MAVIATEHFSSKRRDNQVRGRAGRQGEKWNYRVLCFIGR
ncbi:hypothetical protein [Weissella koreensis]